MAASNAARYGLRINFLTNQQKLHRGIWPWTQGLKSRLPLHYKQRYVDTWMREPLPVHYRADPRKYVADEYGQPKRVQNNPIPITFPKEADIGLWGGEGIVVGLKKNKDNIMKPSGARFWKPGLLKRVLYSEILDRWMEIVVTVRTLDMIDAAYGFDNYILKTHEVDLRSKLGMKLKREMLLALARRSMYSDDPAKCDAIYEKYKEFVVPEEEAEWVGLTLHEAERKQHEVEEEERTKTTRPLKFVYIDDLAEKLKSASLVAGELDEDSQMWSMVKKLSPFKEKSNKTDS